MNEARDLQHPDITAIEQTGYAWFPRRVSAEISEAEAKNFCKDTFETFLAFIMAAHPSIVAEYVDDNKDEILEWRWS